MQPINTRPPNLMTVSARMDEVGALLAKGLLRVWNQSSEKPASWVRQSDLGLGYSANQSVHVDVLTLPTESR